MEPVTVVRKNSSGETVVYGPTSKVRVGQVLAADAPIGGNVQPYDVVRLGKPFMAGNVEMVYGHLGGTARPQQRRQASAPPRGAYRSGGRCVTDGQCSSFGDGSSCGGYDCDGR